MGEFEGNQTSSDESEITVIRSISYSTLPTLAAVMIWLGAIHLNFLLGITVVLFLPQTWTFLIIGLLILLLVVPVGDQSRFGQMFARYVGKYAPGYFPVTVHIEDIKAFDQNQAYVFAAEPHSVFPIGCLSLLNITGTMPLPKTKALASTAVFYTPFLRQIATWMGLIPATKRNFVKCLEAGYSCIIVPGGVQEIIYMKQGIEVAFLKTRFGFVKIAIETGRPLVPVFCFGQSNVYNWWRPEGKLYLRIARVIRFAPLIFWGAFGSPVPYRKPLHIVVGRPIELKGNPKPSKEEVAEVHARFVSELEQLFLRYRGVAGCEDIELRIV